MLLYLGARDVSLLDGGWHVWLEHGGVADTDEPPPKRARFEIAVQRGRRRTLAELRGGSLPAFIDTRSRAEYEGEIDEYLPRRGHLPGAVLVPFADLFDDRGRYVDRKTLLARLAPDLRGRRDRVAYCEVGVRAALFALLHEALTGEVIPVYDGSLMEWSLDPELPMETGL
jgi:thiosulfate/3-mercaptopyruvate sulfurtransferase